MKQPFPSLKFLLFLSPLQNPPSYQMFQRFLLQFVLLVIQFHFMLNLSDG